MTRVEPLLFQSLPRQRLLLALAHHGPMRISDALVLSGGMFLFTTTARKNFYALGLTVAYGDSGKRMMLALNRKYPAFRQFKALLLALNANYPVKGKLLRPFIDRPVPPCDVEDERLHEVFGSRFKTAIVMSISLHGGSIKADVLARILWRINCRNPKKATILLALTKQRVIETHGDVIRFARRLPVKEEITAFVTALVKARPSFDYRKLSGIPVRAVPMASTYDWKKKPVGHEMPVGVAAASDGSPLLFGTIARLRTLVSLAVNGPMRGADIKRATRVSYGTIEKLLALGTLVQVHAADRSRTVGVTINPLLPAYEELVALLRKLGTRWRTKPHQGIDGKFKALARPDNVPVRNFRHFGTKVRNETLLTLFAMKKADGSMLMRAIGASDPVDVTQTLKMLTHYGIVRLAGKEGTSQMYELDPEWFAAAELRAMLAELVRCEPRYAGRAAAAEPQMTPRRKKMKENARKKERKLSGKSSREEQPETQSVDPDR